MKIDGTPSQRAGATERIVSALNRYPLKSLLLGSVAVVVVFCLLIVVYLRLSQAIAFRMVDNLIDGDNVITELCLQSNAAMIDARRLEKDFLLNYPEFGFEESRSRYITRLFVGILEIKGNLERIRALAGDRGTAELTREIEGALERYRLGIAALADKIGERGTHDFGVHNELEGALRQVERLVRATGSDRLLAMSLALTVAEEEYVEVKRDKEALNFAKAFREFNQAIAAAGLAPARRRELLAHVERYYDAFERYVQLTEEIRTIRKEYLKSVQAIDPLLDQLYVGSLERVAARRRAIERSTRLLSLPVLAVGGIVLVVTALFSLTIAITVTRSVAESRSFAERIAAGDYGSRLAPVGRNEFFSLATALNSMAESLREAGYSRQASIDALRESEEKYRSLVETSTDWIWAIDLKGKHTFSNRRVREILGYEPEEVLRQGTFELLHPEDAPRAREVFAASVSAGAGWQGVVLRWRHRDGGYRWIESNAMAVADARGALAGFRGTDRDITERRRLEQELIKTQKLEAIGTLAGGIAHDFNNLLQGLFGYISLARMSLGPGDRAGELLEQAEKALTLSVNLTTQLLTFAKGGQPLKRTLALAGILEDPVKFALSGSRSDYRLVVAEDLWPVDADEGQLGQVIQNLALNASEAMPQGGTVEIAARNETIAADANPLLPAGGDYVRIDVKDSGAGISGRHLARIFDPYFTTKQQGSGLGLATSYSIISSHGGFIDVSSRIGEGSVFSVYLPASRGTVLQTPEPTGAGGQGTGRVLLMDDDGLVREVAAKLLASLGNDVATAANGEEAIELFCSARDAGTPFDLVILDLTVKNGMGGEEAIRRLREISPEIKAVVSSGYSDAAVMADYRAHGFSARLSKPYRLDALRASLGSLLGPSGAPAP